MRHYKRHFCFIFCFLLIHSTSQSYTLTTANNGSLIRWNFGQKFFLAGNPLGRQNYSSQKFYQAVVYALQQWKWASQNVMDFEYWQGTNPQQFEASLSQNGLSSIFFASNSRERTDPNVIGYTQVWFNSNNGEMLESDTLINDVDYDMTDNPADTTSQSTGAHPRVYLNNIITHELGHGIGLSHSTSVNASMLYVEFKEQAKIGCDDWSATRHLYPSGAASTGALQGVVFSPQGDALPGAVITAISKDRGIPLASVHSDQGGNFLFGALESGTVALVVQPYDGSPSAIPARVQTRSQETLCNGQNFKTNFITEADDHSLSEYLIRPNQLTHVSAIKIKCGALQTSANTSYNANTPDMLADIAHAGSTKTYHFIANGDFKIVATSYLLMSAVKVDITVKDATDKPIATTVNSPLYQSDSTYKIFDSQVRGNAVGPIQVQVTSSPISYGSYPSTAMNAESFFVLTFHDSTSAGRSPASVDLPNNARCAPPADLGHYQSPGGNPIRNFSITSRDALGFCGTVKNVEKQMNKRNLPPPSTGAIVGWFFPFMIAALYYGMSLAGRRRLLLN